MFDIGWSELMMIAVVALVVIGPKDLPRALHTFGKWVRQARKVAAEFQSSVEQMTREAELTELRREIEEANRRLAELPGGEPVNTIHTMPPPVDAAPPAPALSLESPLLATPIEPSALPSLSAMQNGSGAVGAAPSRSGAIGGMHPDHPHPPAVHGETSRDEAARDEESHAGVARDAIAAENSPEGAHVRIG